jgi:hypothetical protein
MRLIIHTDGRVEALESDITRELGLHSKTRVSHIEPVNPALRQLFHLIRKRVKDDSLLASWTRRWPCKWQARIFDGPVLGPFKNRQAALAAEINFIEEKLEFDYGTERS